MNLIEALPLGILEGVTEFLPVSSTGHLAIAEGLLGLKVDDPGVTAFTAIIQVGAILAVIIYFRSDIGRLASAWLRGLVNGKAREAPDYRFAWYVILGLIPIGIVRLSSPRPDLGASAQLVGRGGGGARGLERGDVDRRAGRQAGSPGVLAQPEGRSDHRFGAVRCPDSRCVSFPGQPSARACLRALHRVAATRLAFFLAIPALVAAGAYEAIKEASVISMGVGCLPTVLATEVSFVVGYASITWLLRFVAKHSITVFIWYRVALAAVIAVLLGTGMPSPT